MKTVTLLTATGARPEAFALCERWIRNQTYKGDLEWLVVDDCPDKPTKLTMGQTSVTPPMLWTPEVNTQRPNMSALIEKAKGDVLFFIEDDDYFSPEYIEEMLKLLEKSDIAGISNNKYYHVALPGFKYMGNFKHSSLVTTAITREVVPLLWRATHSGEYYIDIKLWEYALQAKLKSTLVAHTNLSIGIKGLKGRKGLGAGHERVGYHADDDYKMFKEWLGVDWIHYKEFLK